MTEYALIVGLIAILCIGVVDRFGRTLQGSFAKSTDALSKRVTAKVDHAGKGGGGTTTVGGGGGGGSEVVSGGSGDEDETPGKPAKKPQH